MKQESLYPSFTPRFVAEALNLPYPALRSDPPEVSVLPAFSSVVTDSRKIQPNCLFVALKGENFDGHDFIEGAISQGAKGIVCKKGTPAEMKPGIFLYKVDDTLQAFRKLGHSWRKQFSIPVVVVAGSVGKTTTKELLASILTGKFSKVLKTQGSQNGFVGIPMTLLDLKPEDEAAVIEVGIDEIGAMEKHLSIVLPNFALVTAIGPEHLEKMIDVPSVAREEGLALTIVAKNGGLVAINMDDPWIRPHMKTIREGRKLGYSLDPSTSGAGALSGEPPMILGKLSQDGTQLKIRSESYPLPLLGQHNARNLLGAVAMATGIGLTSNEIRKGLATFRGPSGRSEVQNFGGSTYICDYYNANPDSVEAGLDLLTQIAKKKENSKVRWVVVGDMLELGPDEEKFHRGLASKLINLNIEHVLLYGPRMLALEDELKTRSFKGTVSHYGSHGEIIKALTGAIRPGDSVLIKGSHGMKMEEVWKGLTQREHKNTSTNPSKP